jgi:hypothetical protein
MSKRMKIILPAGQIPPFSTVTKKTGEKPYELRDHITIFKVPEGSALPTRLAGEGILFMVDERGSIECVTHDKELMWHLKEPELLAWLQEREMERESK